MRCVNEKSLKFLLRFVLALTFCGLSFACSAEDGVKHPIDVWLDHAIEKDVSTIGVREATDQARAMWDREMNKSYNHLMARINKRQQDTLRESQRQWLKFREADGKVISQIIASKEGTIFQMTATTYGMQLVRARALQLDSYDKSLESE